MNDAVENAKKLLEEERKISDKSRAEYAARSKGRPTPTQEENDLAMLGGNTLEHEPDGSDPEPAPSHETSGRHMEAERPHGHAKPAGSYQTRSSSAKRE